MVDTTEALKKLDYSKTKSRIAVLAENLKGGQLASEFEIID